MYKFHIGMQFKNDYDVIFCTQLLNSAGESIADYNITEDKLRVADSIDSLTIFNFMNDSKRAYKQFIKESA